MKDATVINPLTETLPKEIDDSEAAENQISLDEWYQHMAVRKTESEKENINGGNNLWIK